MPTSPETQRQLRLLTDAVFRVYHQDFRHYAMQSMRRRVLLAQRRLGYASLQALREGVEADPAAYEQLAPFLSVVVSDMFRDPQYYLALRREVLPVLRTYPSLRVWVAGCSTGEEAYSLAILLREEGLLERTIVHATDINQAALEQARCGTFALQRAHSHAASYREAGGLASFSDYYTTTGGVARFDPSLRDAMTFDDHSLATDSVFAETHLVSCRNVLMYFDPALQERAVSLFHESLARRCFLGLGANESLDLSLWNTSFEPLSRPERIYRKR